MIAFVTGALALVAPTDVLVPLASWAPAPPAMRLAWALSGADAKDWIINNYVDVDPGPGICDYRGGAKSYDGHRGVDVDVPTFRAMDAGRAVLAAADGVVMEAIDEHPDRHTAISESAPWNHVTLRHANGWRTIYGHLKRDSVTVSVGERVTAGAALGVVGSSGRSTAPHLQFEVRDERGAVVSPFGERLWIHPPAYDTPLGLMDVVLVEGAMPPWLKTVAQVPLGSPERGAVVTVRLSAQRPR